MPPKASPKPLTASELLSLATTITNAANRMVFTGQLDSSKYVELSHASTILIDAYLSMSKPVTPEAK